MGKYLKLFKNHAQYETFIGGGGDTPFVKPNVSHCIGDNHVHYNPFFWVNEYLTFVALEDGEISFNILNSMGTDKITSISYSRDNGATWTTTANQNDKQHDLSITVEVNKGDKILWKGIAETLGFFDEGEGSVVGSFFSSTAKFDAAGNVMSLIYGDNYKNKITIEKEYAFCHLFSDYYGEKTCGIVNAKNLVLPATTLAEYCYSNMFSGCTSLVTAPELPATTLANECYVFMFEGCTSLVTAPELPATTLAIRCYENMFNGCTILITAPVLSATTLAEGCYSYMFYGCTGLVTAPELPATTLADYCYNSMFDGCTNLVNAPQLPVTTLAQNCYSGMFNSCTSLTTAPELPATTLESSCYGYMFYGCTGLTSAPELPATTLASSCYSNMFRGCTSLTTAPELHATTLAQDCYSSMFQGCTSLVTAPELPVTTLASGCYQYMFNDCTSLANAPVLSATTLATSCYNSMFRNCTNLKTAPELPATTLVDSCYAYMFYGCSSLNYIKAMFTTTPGTNYTQFWVSGVASSGTFVKNADATWDVTGVHGVPTGWTIDNGPAYVDLGLTSGTKWAKMNVGADSPTDYGYYFAWGETQGYTADQVGTDKQFSVTDYKFNPSGDGSTFTRYNADDGITTLELEDDAAAAYMGGDWHMPTEEQCKELLKETKNGYVTNEGTFTEFAWDDSGDDSRPTETTATINGWDTAGYLFFKSDVSDINAAITNGDYLFIPAAGKYANSTSYYIGNDCLVQVPSLDSDFVENALGFGLSSLSAGVGGGSYRCNGESVRGVVGQMDEITV